MWKPSNNIEWQSDALCAKPDNAKYRDWFFSKDPKEKYDAKNLCYECPVRAKCLQWALEHRQIWGTWGGKDESEMRRALSVSYKGEEIKRRRYPHCPYCSARPAKLETSSQEIPGGGRWTVAKIVTCTVCGFSWRSRTSVNAIESYKQERIDKSEKRARIREKKALRLKQKLAAKKLKAKNKNKNKNKIK